MPIFKKGLAALACLILAACAGGLGQSRNAPSEITLPDGTIVAGASGWCIDEATSRASRNTSVVVLGSCAAIAGEAKAPRPNVPGVVTVSVEAEPGAMPDGEALQKFFVSDAGRAALARNGEADSVSILETRLEDDLLYLHAADSSVAPGASNEIWRALFGLSGRFIVVSFFSRPEDSIESEDGLNTLADQVAQLREANQG